jgi:putative FmdB family regulatory protein
MPLYEYECDACRHRFEIIQKFSDPPVAVCPACGGAVRKLQSAPAFQFKGNGWYITDYARKDQPAGKAGEAGEKTGKETGDKTGGAPSEQAAQKSGEKTGTAAASDAGGGAAKSDKPAAGDGAKGRSGAASAASTPAKSA